MESAILYRRDDLHCDTCLSLPVPPVYHCIQGHFLCSKCYDDDTKQCTMKNCKQDMPLCKVTTFLLKRMLVVCPNDKSHGCSTSLPIEDFTTHVEQCSQSPLQHTCSCPCCDTTYADISALMCHFNIHGPTGVALEQPDTLTLAQRHKHLLKLGSSTYLLLKFEGDTISLQHMWWDAPRYHELHVSDSDHNWGFTGAKTFDTLSTTTEQCLKLPLIFPFPENITVVFMIGGLSDAKTAVLDLHDLPGHDNLPLHAAVKDLVCLLCEKIVTNPVNHCTAGHTLCLLCSHENFKLEKKKGKVGEELTKCPYCTQKIMRCEVGSYILRNSEFRCPNRGVGCQDLSIHEFETHVDNCKMLFTCPVCGHGYDDLEYVRKHLVASHRPKRINYKESTMLMVWPGRTWIKERFTGNDFLLIFQDNRLCLQHMGWAKSQVYFIEFDDLDGKWSFHGQTLAVEKCPILNAGSLKIPSTVLNPKSTQPILINLEIRHADDDYMHDIDEIADLEKQIKIRARFG